MAKALQILNRLSSYYIEITGQPIWPSMPNLVELSNINLKRKTKANSSRKHYYSPVIYLKLLKRSKEKKQTNNNCSK
jgi:hypothetical protein